MTDEYYLEMHAVIRATQKNWMHDMYPRLSICFMLLQMVTVSPPACILYTVINQTHRKSSNINMLKTKLNTAVAKQPKD